MTNIKMILLPGFLDWPDLSMGDCLVIAYCIKLQSIFPPKLYTCRDNFSLHTKSQLLYFGSSKLWLTAVMGE